MLMPWRMAEEEEGAFWHGLDLETQEELERGPLPPNIQLKELGQWIPWGQELQLA